MTAWATIKRSESEDGWLCVLQENETGDRWRALHEARGDCGCFVAIRDINGVLESYFIDNSLAELEARGQGS